MATFLYRVGRFSFRRRGAVVGVWLLLLVALIGAVVSIGAASSASITIPGTESQRALTALSKEFPQASGASGTVVVRAPKGQSVTAATGQQVIAGVVSKAKEVPGVVGVVGPAQSKAISRDGRFALVTVQFSKQADALTDRQRTAYDDLGKDQPSGWTVAAGGEPTQAPPEVGSTEGIGVLVALVVLVITFGSLVAAGMTMLNALVGVGIGYAAITLLGHVFDFTSVTPVLALMLGLAVGIDYSLFITSRYRHNLSAGLDREEAVGRAVGTAGSAVLFAGLTVVIALAGLSVVGIPFLTSMGLAAAGTVAVAVLVALTMLPAVLAFAGDKVRSKRERRAEHIEDKPGFGFRWGRFTTRFRVPVLVGGVIVLAVLALPVTHMRLALPDDGTAPSGTSKRVAYDLISEGFGPGFNGRLIAVVHGDDATAVQQGVARVTQVATGEDDVAAATASGISQDNRTALVSVVPKSGPSDQATFDLVRDLRSDLAGTATSTGTTVSVTGATAIGVDVSDKLKNALPVYLLVVVGLSFLLLMLVFRSLLVPLKATLGFLLTVGAAFGVTVAVFQDGHLASLVGLDTSGPLVSFLPILLIGILFGLAMDYEVFLVSRMREDFVHGDPVPDVAQQAIVSGIGHGARVVVAAALIMISVFAGFVLVDDPTIKSMGFALAFGVLVDAFVVRLSLVPAFLSFLGNAAWWLPRWLDKALPDVDVEGESLRQLDEPGEPDREPQPV
ncbi:MMPL family transporter [Nocardioides mangrovicus]|uniref:MMPL family transporter n=1 Tax=Nocardioides mangrovicus TaxID=2478913 RepID=A0A3L8NWV9_9ACTN|nr:MMPL family transporter [Nocardioides mangrovicus]RLV47736.1 MMPL family transporter [Nocardioides mangrovicus]